MKLQQIKQLMKELESADAEIASIQKVARRITNKELAVGLTISLPGRPFMDRDPDGGFSHPFLSGFIGMGSFLGQQQEPKARTDDFKFEVGETETLQILGVLVAHKESKRMHIIAQLQQAGIPVTV